MYNDTYFLPDTIQLDNPTTNQPSNNIDKEAFTEHVNPITLPAAQLLEESGNIIPEIDDTSVPTNSPCEHHNIETSKYKSFLYNSHLTARCHHNGT